MPSTSKKQHNFMAAIANNPAFSKKVGIPQSVGKDFTAADKGRKFRTGGRPAINKQDTQHGSMDMPFKSVRKFAGMQSGGKVKKYEDGGGVEDYLNRERTESDVAEKAAQPSAAKPKIITKEQLGGMSLRDYMNNMQGKTRRGASETPSYENEGRRVGGASKLDQSGKPYKTLSERGAVEPSRMQRYFTDPDRNAAFLANTEKIKKGGNIKGMKKGGLARGGMVAPMMASGGKMKYNFEKSGKDVEKKGMKEGSKADMALDKKQMMKMGGMAGMHKMPDGKMMKDSAMKMRGMKEGGMAMVEKDGKMVPDFAADGKGKMKMGGMAGMKKMMGGGMSGYAKGGGIESKGKTKGTVVRMASGGSVSSASRRADGIAQRGKTRC